MSRAQRFPIVDGTGGGVTGGEPHRLVLERFGVQARVAGVGRDGRLSQPAAGGEPHVDDLDRIVRVRIPVSRLVHLQEPLAQVLGRGNRYRIRAGVSRCDRDRKLEVLPDIARVDPELEPAARGRDTFGVEPGDGAGGQGLGVRGEAAEPGCIAR